MTASTARTSVCPRRVTATRARSRKRSDTFAWCDWNTISTELLLRMLAQGCSRYGGQMRLGLEGGSFPGERLSEPTRVGTERPDQRRRAGNSPESRSHRGCVAMWYKEARLTITYRFPDPRRTRGDDRRSAGCRLEIGDAPPFLRRRKRERPRAPEEGDLVLFTDTPKKPCPTAEVKRGGEALERGTVVTCARDLEGRE